MAKNTSSKKASSSTNGSAKTKSKKAAATETPYRIFQKKRIAELKTENPDQSGKDRQKQISEEWKVEKAAQEEEQAGEEEEEGESS
ncbi:hypothetical protein JCM3766R1_004804 [Sporobolomyces carnicolor]